MILYPEYTELTSELAVCRKMKASRKLEEDMDDFEDDDPFARKRKKVRASCRVCFAFLVSKCVVAWVLPARGKLCIERKMTRTKKRRNRTRKIPARKKRRRTWRSSNRLATASLALA